MSGATFMHTIIARTRLLFAVIPLSLCVVGIRAAAWIAPHSTLRLLPALDPSVLSSFIAAAIFVVALLLNGVMSDYKESEKLPSEIESLFTSLHAQARHGPRVKGFDSQPTLRAIHRMLLAFARFLDGTHDYGATLEEFSQGEDALMFELDSKGCAGGSSTQLFNLRAKMSRINIIRETSFLPAAYMLADSLVSLVLTLLIITRNPSAETGYVNAAVFSCLFLYLSILIRDIDDPFGYTARHNERMLEMERLAQPRLGLGFFMNASSIDFSILFVTFGTRLHKDLRAKGVDVRALYASSLAASGRTLAGADATAAAACDTDDNLLRPEIISAMVPAAQAE